MKRKMALTIALALSLISLATVRSDSTAKAQGTQQRFRADSGMVKLGPNQILRVTFGWDLNNDGVFAGAIGQIYYVQGTCSGGGLCKHIAVNPNPVFEKDQFPDVISKDISPMPGSSGVRAIVVGERQNAHVTFQIIDTSTGEIVAIWVPQGSPAVGNR